MKNKIFILSMTLVFSLVLVGTTNKHRIRDYGLKIGQYPTGKFNAITDVAGVRVGQVTIHEGSHVHTGVTAILPHEGNLMQQKVPAAIYIANGFGKLTGYSQVRELGNIETPIILTNTLSVPTAADALIDYTLSFPENKWIKSINPVVGETNDGWLNDICGRHVKKSHVLEAIKRAAGGFVKEGSVGAGTGTICFGYKGGIGTASRILPESKGGFSIGVLVQTNYGGNLTIAGVPVGKELNERQQKNSGDGSCMVVVATNAPITSRNLKRLARRAVFGIARTGGNCSNGSGEYVIAFSTHKTLRIPHWRNERFLVNNKELRNDRVTPLFEAVSEACEEAILNSLFMATTVKREKKIMKNLPVKKVLEILKEYRLKISNPKKL